MKIGNVTLHFNDAGWPFIGIFAAITFVFFLFSPILFVLGLIATAWCFYFFRDPPRITPIKSGLIISPADGQVVAVREVLPETDLGLGSEPRTRISIFLNVLNVHVNRIPADGTVKERLYRPGKFVNASLDKASVDNERMALVLKLSGDHPYAGHSLGVVQIAGLIARRILCSAQVGQSFKAGQRYGIIRFGSRADVYLPAGMKALVSVGQSMIGGETVLADATAQEDNRAGEQRE